MLFLFVYYLSSDQVILSSRQTLRDRAPQVQVPQGLVIEKLPLICNFKKKAGVRYQCSEGTCVKAPQKLTSHKRLIKLLTEPCVLFVDVYLGTVQRNRSWQLEDYTLTGYLSQKKYSMIYTERQKLFTLDCKLLWYPKFYNQVIFCFLKNIGYFLLNFDCFFFSTRSVQTDEPIFFIHNLRLRPQRLLVAL